MPLIPEPLLAKGGAEVLSTDFEIVVDEQEGDESRLRPFRPKNIVV